MPGSFQSVEKVRYPAVFYFFIFNFYVGVFGALPPFPTSFLVPKKEAKKASAASPLTVLLLKTVVFRQAVTSRVYARLIFFQKIKLRKKRLSAAAHWFLKIYRFYFIFLKKSLDKL